MALLYRAEIKPTKLELLAAWLPGRSWFEGASADGVARVAAFRFDDPAGEVGIANRLVRVEDGPIYQVPLTYRGAPLDGGDDWLIGTTEHSVLGRRWVYDAPGDPVYSAALAGAVAGTPQAEEYVEVDGRHERREPAMTVSAFGSLPEGAGVTLVRRPGDGPAKAGAGLTGTWPGQETPVLLAYGA